MTEEELFEKWKSEQYKDQSTEEKFEFVEHLHNFPQYFKKAFLAGFNAKTQWHDLRKNPDDLPIDNRNVSDQNGNSVRYVKHLNKWFYRHNVCEANVIVWCELPKFEE